MQGQGYKAEEKVVGKAAEGEGIVAGVCDVSIPHDAIIAALTMGED